MLMTFLLTLCNIILLCLMILAATVFMPYRGLAKNFPKDVQEALKPRLDEIDRQLKAPRVFGGILIIMMFLLFIAVFIIGGIDGIYHNFSFGQHLLRFLIIVYGTKAFDIIALDYFLLTKTSFFPHFFPETKGCAESFRNAGVKCVIHVGKGMHHCYALQYFIPGCKPAFDEIMRLIQIYYKREK